MSSISDRLLNAIEGVLFSAGLSQEEGELEALVLAHSIIETYTPKHPEPGKVLLEDTLRNLAAQRALRLRVEIREEVEENP